MIRIAVSLALLAGLAGCQGEKKDDNRSAEGEILPGSVSDAMLPLDTVRSQPPLAPKSEIEPAAKGDAKARPSDSASADPTEPASAAPEPAPVVEPSAE
ncbi:MAG: hypothetical protein ACREBO_12965 [Novosphingobium sp.]